MEGQFAADAERRAALRRAVPRDDQHRHGTTSRRASGFAWSPFDSRRTVVRGSAGLFYDRVPLRALANALLSAGNTTDLDQLRQIEREPVADAGGRAGLSEHPERRGAVGHAVQPDDDGSRHAERLFAAGERRGRAADRGTQHRQRRLPVLAGAEPDHVGESERAVVRGGRDQQRLPPEPDLREQQPVLVGGGLQLSRPACLVRAAAGAVGQLSRQLLAVEVDEQRRRELLQPADRSVRPVEGLGPIRRRPAASARALRLGQFADGAGPHRLGTDQPWLSVEQHAAGVLGVAVQHHLRRDDRAGHRRPARSSTASSSSATPASATISSA